MQLPIKRYLLRYFLPFCLLYGLLVGLSYTAPVRAGLFSFARTNTARVLNTTLSDAMFITDPAMLGIKEEGHERFTIAYANRAAVENQLKADRKRGKDRPDEVDFKNFSLNLTEFYLLPLIFLFALIMVTPISWKRKGIALLIGFFLLYLFKAFHLYIVGLYQIDQNDIGIYELGTTAKMVVSRLRLTLHTALAFVLPVFIWIGVCFRGDDWKNIKLQ